MPVLDLVLTQLTDVFRLGLLAALVYTTQRTARATGTLVPLLAGAVFVAVIIPTTRGSWSWAEIGIGVATNLVILAVMLAVMAALRRYGRGS